MLSPLCVPGGLDVRASAGCAAVAGPAPERRRTYDVLAVRSRRQGLCGRRGQRQPRREALDWWPRTRVRSCSPTSTVRPRWNGGWGTRTRNSWPIITGWSRRCWPRMAGKKSAPGAMSFPRCSPRRGPARSPRSRRSGRWRRMRGRPGRRCGPGWPSKAVRRHPRRRSLWRGRRYAGRPGSRRRRTAGRCWCRPRRPGCCAIRCPPACGWRILACTGWRTGAGPSGSSSCRPRSCRQPSAAAVAGGPDAAE